MTADTGDRVCQQCGDDLRQPGGLCGSLWYCDDCVTFYTNQETTA